MHLVSPPVPLFSCAGPEARGALCMRGEEKRRARASPYAGKIGTGDEARYAHWTLNSKTLISLCIVGAYNKPKPSSQTSQPKY